MSDGQGGTATSTANVTVRLDHATSLFKSVSPAADNGDGTTSITLHGYGIPGNYYDLQESSDVSFVNPPPTVVATVQAAANGVVQYTDTFPTSGSSRFYRFAVH